MNYSYWKNKIVNPLDIYLDELNPRVIIQNYTQKNIREYLIKNFDVIELANSIIQSNGLPPTEKILCVEENNHFVVVEGNRRISACQIILKPELLNINDKGLTHVSEELKSELKQLEIIIAPNRDDTESYITLRHTGNGVKRWSRLAENRRYIIRYEGKKQTTNQISRTLNIPKSDIEKGIKFYYFIEYIRKEIKWTKKEQDILNSPLLMGSKIDRFLPFSKPAQNIMKISFDKNLKMKFDIPKENFNKALKIIVKKIFIDESIDTRTKINKVFTEEIKAICSSNAEDLIIHKNPPKNDHLIDNSQHEKTPEAKTKNHSKSAKNKIDLIESNNKNEIVTAPKHNQPKPKPPNRFFQDIIYEGDNKGIERTLYEIQNIDPKKFLLSATYLMRTLLECALQNYLTRHNLLEKWSKKNQDPSITDLINYCAQYNVFKPINTNYQRVITDAKSMKDSDQLNSIAHAKFNLPNEERLWNIEKRWYIFVKFLLNDN